MSQTRHWSWNYDGGNRLTKQLLGNQVSIKNYVELLKDGILTKKGLGIKGYNDYLRITLGPPRQIKIFISKLKNLQKS